MDYTKREKLVRSSRAIAGGLGLLCLIAAVAAAGWETDVEVLAKTRFLLGTIGVLLGAVAILGPAFTRAYTGVAVVLLNTLLLAFGAELGSSVADTLEKDDPSLDPVNAVLAATPFQQRHSLEFTQSDVRQLEPYVLWSLSPYNGETITINASGLRETPGSRCGANSYTVFMFGGSTMWGAGAPDSETIPAFVRRLLPDVGRPLCIVNYAQSGYVLGQNVALLVDLLLAGKRPDLVISYEGYNDVYVAYEYGLAHRQFNYDDLNKIFESQNSHWYHSLSIYWRLRSLVSEELQWRDYATLGKDADTLSAEVANRYLQSYAVIEALAAKWKFDFALFVQPSISMSRKRLTRAEQTVRAEVSEPLHRLMVGVYGRLEQGARERKRLFYIADVFDQMDGELWIDDAHVPGAGNKAVAERIVAILAREKICPEVSTDEISH